MTNTWQIAARATGACALALALAAPAQATPGLQMSAASTATGFDVTVSARDVVDLYAYQFTLDFDPGLLNAVSGMEGSFLSNQGSTYFSAGEIDNDTGAIRYVLSTLTGPVAGANGSGDLATFSFGVKQSGLASFRLSDVTLLDASGAVLTVDVRNLVTAVPEPASLALFGFGLIALLGARTLRQRAL